MSFGFGGICGCGRLGGGSEKWTKLKTKCDMAISRGLVARSNAAIEACRAIYRTTALEEEEGNIVQPIQPL